MTPQKSDVLIIGGGFMGEREPWRKEAESRLGPWLERLGLADWRKKKTNELSKGMQQKVQFIGALLHEPELVILDEPFSGLDPINQEKVVGFLRQLKARGMTVILSAHQMAMVEKLADHMLLMAQGQVVLAGTLAQIRAQSQNQRQLKVAFSTGVSAEQLQQLPALAAAEPDGQHWLLTLAEAVTVSQCLQQVLQLGELSQVEMQNTDLHQLYLAAMAKHQPEVAA